MNILTIDTSTKMESIAVSTGDKIADHSGYSGNNHSRVLINNIHSALSELSLTINDINLIGVGIGPGSFTGIRIAVTTARMFSQILNIPIVGFSTLYLYASSINSNPGENILVAFDAKKNRVFGALYKKNQNNELEKIISPGDFYMEDLSNHIESSEKVHLIGDGIEKYIDIIKNKAENYRYYKDLIPSGEAACRLTEEKYLNNEHTEYKMLKPLYTRKSDAEVAKESRENGSSK